jgi:tetratricopeptide (TPR) repeat protein
VEQARSLAAGGDPRAAALAWHRQEAEAGLGVENSFATVFHLDWLIEANPKDGALFARRAWHERQLRHWDRAIADSTRAIELGVTGPEVWSGRGWCFLEQQQWDKALHDFNRVIEQLPKNPHGWYGRGVARVGQQRWADAAADFGQADTLDKEDQRFLWVYPALAHLAGRQEAEYRRLCTQLLQRFREADYSRHLDVTWTCVLSPKASFDRAVLREWAETAVAQDPRNARPLCVLGAVLYRSDDANAAVGKLQEAVRLQEDFPAAWLFLAMSHQRLGQAKEARQWLDRAVRWLDKEEQTLSWHQRLELRLLRQEAEELLKQGKP